jgi:hypothetical protein
MAGLAFAPLAARGGRPAQRESALDRAFGILSAFGADQRSLVATVSLIAVREY